jgi:hypothetical protein
LSHEYVLWVVVIGCTLHVLEESVLEWVSVTRPMASRFGVTITWSDFYVVNAAMIVGGIAGAMIGWRSPEISLMLPALTAINALPFHVGGSLAARRLVPGTITAVLIYLPVAAWAYYGAYLDGVLTTQVIVVSVLGGALLMAFPIAMMWLKSRLR